MKIFWTALLVALGLVIAATLVGMILPRQHIATFSEHADRVPEEIWNVMTEVRQYPQWKPDVKDVVVISGEAEPLAWTETSLRDEVTSYRVINSLEPLTWEIQVIHPQIPPGGKWLFELKPNGEGTDISVTETAQVRNPLMRFIDRFILGYTHPVQRYLKALQQRLDETPATVE